MTKVLLHELDSACALLVENAYLFSFNITRFYARARFLNVGGPSMHHGRLKEIIIKRSRITNASKCKGNVSCSPNIQRKITQWITSELVADVDD